MRVAGQVKTACHRMGKTCHCLFFKGSRVNSAKVLIRLSHQRKVQVQLLAETPAEIFWSWPGSHEWCKKKERCVLWSWGLEHGAHYSPWGQGQGGTHRDPILMPSLLPSSPVRSIAHVAGNILAWTSCFSIHCHRSTREHKTRHKRTGGQIQERGLQSSRSRLMATGEGNPAYMLDGLEGEAWGSYGHHPHPTKVLIQWEEAKRKQGQSRGFQRVGSRAEVDCLGLSQN